MIDLSEYIEDYVLGNSLPDEVKRRFKERMESDESFREEVEQYRQTVEALQLHGIKQRIKSAQQNTDPPQKRFSNRKYLLGGILIVSIVLILIYQTTSPDTEKSDIKMAPVERPIIKEKPPNNPEEETEIEATEESEPTIDEQDDDDRVPMVQEETQPEIKASGSPTLAMAYFEKRMPVYSGSRGDREEESKLSENEQALQVCINLIAVKRFTLASNCLERDFGNREEDAQWFRALTALAIEGKREARPRIENISGDRLHIYSRQAKQLLEEL